MRVPWVALELGTCYGSSPDCMQLQFLQFWLYRMECKDSSCSKVFLNCLQSGAQVWLCLLMLRWSAVGPKFRAIT